MKTVIIALFLFCTAYASDSEVGPLEKLTEFNVLVFGTYSDGVNVDSLCSLIKDELASIGNVRFDQELANAESRPTLVFSIAKDCLAYVFCEVEVPQNKFKTTCPIWSILIPENRGGEPFVQDDKVSFNPLEPAGLNAVEAVSEMLAQFIETYQRDNPSGERPIFYYMEGP